MSSLHFALRLTEHNHEDMELLSSFLSSKCSNFLACRETEASNPHAHVYGITGLSYKGLQTAVRRHFPQHIGNAGYSLKQCDNEVIDYLRYICKGDGEGEYPDVVCRQGLEYTDEFIVELHEAYWCTNAVIKENSLKRDRLKLKGTVIEQIEKQAKELKYTGHQREEIAGLYVKMYVDARKPVNVYHAKGVINTVCAILSGAQFDILVNTCAER